jgi:hypothetical protein
MAADDRQKSGGGATVVRFVRLKCRVYSDSGRLLNHAEYALIGEHQVLARLVFNRGAWVALECRTDDGFGKPVSPINLTLLRDVKKWALEKWSKS